MQKPRVRIFEDKSEMSSYLVRLWKEIAAEAFLSRGFFAAALSGGTTPADFYEKLAELKDSFPWRQSHIFLVDERCVPFSDDDSNYGMMRRLFLREVRIPVENIHPIMTENFSHAKAAKLYETELTRFFGVKDKVLPEFDFLGLGIGEDGHTASLFPGGAELLEKKSLAVPVKRSGVNHPRVSLTLQVINNARNVVFIVTGRGKAAIMKRVIEDREEGLPAARIEPEHGDLYFVLDSDAASLLTEK